MRNKFLRPPKLKGPVKRRPAETVEYMRKCGSIFGLSEVSERSSWFERAFLIREMEVALGRKVKSKDLEDGLAYSGYIGCKIPESHITTLRRVGDFLVYMGITDPSEVYGIRLSEARNISEQHTSKRLNDAQVRELFRMAGSRYRDREFDLRNIKNVSHIEKIKDKYGLRKFET